MSVRLSFLLFVSYILRFLGYLWRYGSDFLNIILWSMRIYSVHSSSWFFKGRDSIEKRCLIYLWSFSIHTNVLLVYDFIRPLVCRLGYKGHKDIDIKKFQDFLLLFMFSVHLLFNSLCPFSYSLFFVSFLFFFLFLTFCFPYIL